MKKTVITMCAIGLAAMAAQAQGFGTTADVNGYGKEYIKAKTKTAANADSQGAKYLLQSDGTKMSAIMPNNIEARKVGSIDKAVRKQAVKQYRQMYVMGAMGDMERYAAAYAQQTESKKQAVADEKTADKKVQNAEADEKVIASAQAKAPTQAKTAPAKGEKKDNRLMKLWLENSRHAATQPFK